MRCQDLIVKLRSRSRSGEGQVRVRRVRRVRFGPELYPIFGFHPPTTHQELFSWLLRCLDKSDGPRMGWYDSGIVRGGQDFKVDFKVDIK